MEIKIIKTKTRRIKNKKNNQKNLNSNVQRPINEDVTEKEENLTTNAHDSTLEKTNGKNNLKIFDNLIGIKIKFHFRVKANK